jgi:hypothetical protein
MSLENNGVDVFAAQNSSDAKRHLFSTPCARTGSCQDCNSPQRICNKWSIIDKCYPEGRIKVILIDDDLGL